MVLELTHHDLVAAVDVLTTIAVGDQIDGLGRPADEDDLARVARADERRCLRAYGLERLGHLHTQRMHPAVDVGRDFLGFHQGGHDRRGLLGRARAVEIHQRATVDPSLEGGKLLANELRLGA